MSTELFCPCWESSSTCSVPTRHSDWGIGSKGQRQWAGLLRDSHWKQISYDGRATFAYSWRMWRRELRLVWSLIKDGSWYRRSYGSALCTPFMSQVASCILFSFSIPVALFPPLPLPICCSACCQSDVTLSPVIGSPGRDHTLEVEKVHGKETM